MFDGFNSLQARRPPPRDLNLGKAGIGVLHSLPDGRKPLELLEPVLNEDKLGDGF